MTTPARSRFVFLAQAAAPVFLLLTAVAVLLRFPPAQHSFYPLCPIRQYFGILCPGCGATRALAALLRGHVHEALRLNALFVLILPILGGYAVSCYLKLIAHKPLRWPQPPPVAIYITLAAAMIFTIARNG